MHVELQFIPHPYLNRLAADADEPLTPTQYWRKCGHTLNPAQTQLLEPENESWDVALLEGETGCGKTHAAVLLGIELACTRPMSTGLVTATQQAIVQLHVLQKYRQLLPQLGLLEGTDYRLSQQKITFANGSTIWFLPVTGQRSALIECQWIHVEHMHTLTESQFNQLMLQLRQPNACGDINGLRFFGTSAPTPADSWQHTVFAPGNAHGFRTVTGHTDQNPALPDWYVQWAQTQPAAANPPEKAPEADPATEAASRPDKPTLLQNVAHTLRHTWQGGALLGELRVKADEPTQTTNDRAVYKQSVQGA
jgi:hypothetical protein